MDLNKVMIIGNVTQDPESRTTQQGQNVCTFSVATNLIWTDKSGQRQQRPEYHNVVTWRKLADICAQYLTKGKKIYIEGRLQTRNWEGKDGVKRYRTEIVADNMIMLSGGGDGSRGSFAAGGKTNSTAPKEKNGVVGLPTVQLEDEGLKKSTKETVDVAASKDTKDSKAKTDEQISIDDIPF